MLWVKAGKCLQDYVNNWHNVAPNGHMFCEKPGKWTELVMGARHPGTCSAEFCIHILWDINMKLQCLFMSFCIVQALTAVMQSLLR